jgi:CBS domain-containing protein
MTWASKPLDTPASEVIAVVRMGITIESIATPRAMLAVRQKCHWPGFMNESELKEFDHVPVTDGDEIVGVFDRESGAVRDLSEAMFMASDASLMSFVENADRRKFALLVRESQIVGIVTLADIQKLPVYCVLFSLLMSVEMLLMEWIRKVCQGDPDKWIAHLNDRAKRRIEDYWEQAQKKNVALDKLSCASFTDELTAARGLGLFSSNERASASLERLNELRDLVCHGKEIALTLDRALEIPAHVRDALDVQGVLDNSLKGLPA